MGMGGDTMNLVATPARMVFAMVTSQMMKAAVVAARDQAKGQGKGFFGQVAAQMGWQSVICQQYGNMPVDAILTQYPGSFAVPNAQVKRIRFESASIDDDGGTSHDQMLVETMGGKFRFNLTSMSIKDARNLLKQVLPHAVR